MGALQVTPLKAGVMGGVPGLQVCALLLAPSCWKAAGAMLQGWIGEWRAMLQAWSCRTGGCSALGIRLLVRRVSPAVDILMSGALVQLPACTMGVLGGLVNLSRTGRTMVRQWHSVCLELVVNVVLLVLMVWRRDASTWPREPCFGPLLATRRWLAVSRRLLMCGAAPGWGGVKLVGPAWVGVGELVLHGPAPAAVEVSMYTGWSVVLANSSCC